jgi:hypothetical protein
MICWLLMLIVSGSLCQAEDPTRAYFDGLRQRHLFGIAEGYCLNELARPRLSDQKRARYSLELIRTLSAHAASATPAEQDELWKRAEETIAQIERDHPRWSDLPLFQAERARISYLKATQLYWQSQAIPRNEALRDSAIDNLDQAVNQLTLSEQQIQKLLNKAGANQDFTVLSVATVRDSLLDFQLLIAEADMKLAGLYHADSPKRKMSLAAARKWLDPLARRASTLKITWVSRLALIACERLEGDADAAARALQGLVKDQHPAFLNEPVFVESMRILLAQNQAQLAATKIIEYRQEQGRHSSELAFLEIDALLRLHKIAADKKQQELADELWKQIQKRSQQLTQSQPGYWSQRAKLLVNQQEQIQEYGSRLSESLQRAQLLYSEGKLPEAIAAYDKTSQQAAQEGKTDLAFELGFTSASLQLKQKQYREAAEQFQSLAKRYDAAPKAADASLLAAWCLGQLYSQSRTKTRRLAYTAALEDVRKQFPAGSAYDEAGWMLARLEESRLQYSKALVLYSEIPENHARAADAHLGVARCYEQILVRLAALGKPTDAWRQEASDVLEKYLANFPAESNPAILLSQAEIGLRLTRIYLNDTPPEYNKAHRLLELIIHTANTKPEELKRNSEHSPESVAQTTQTIQGWNRVASQALRMQIIALAGQGKPSEARSLVASLENAGTTELLSVLNGVSHIDLDLSPSVRRELGMLQLQSAEKLASRRNDLTPQQIRQLDLCLAEAYLAIDRPIRALEYYQALLKKSPRDNALKRQVALLLEQCGTKECLRQAIPKWRELEAAEKAGSVPWLDARLHIIRAQFESGDTDAAKKLLGVTRLLYPELGNVDLKKQYRELEQQIQK